MSITPANNTEKLIDVFAQQIQELETAQLEILTDTRLANAEGDQLDITGAIVGRDRGGSTDARYYDLIRAQALLNRYSGTIPQIIEILETVLGSSISFEFTSYFPAAFEIDATAQALQSGQGATIVSIVKSAKLGGVNGLFKYHETDPVFKLDGADGSQFDGGFHMCTSL
jgi:hypothetical protein